LPNPRDKVLFLQKLCNMVGAVIENQVGGEACGGVWHHIEKRRPAGDMALVVLYWLSKMGGAFLEILRAPFLKSTSAPGKSVWFSVF